MTATLLLRVAYTTAIAPNKTTGESKFLWKAWLMMGQAQYQKGEFEEDAATFSYM